MFWATVILSAGTLSGPPAGQPVQLRPDSPRDARSNTALVEKAGEAGQGQIRSIATNPGGLTKNPQAGQRPVAGTNPGSTRGMERSRGQESGASSYSAASGISTSILPAQQRGAAPVFASWSLEPDIGGSPAESNSATTGFWNVVAVQGLSSRHSGMIWRLISPTAPGNALPMVRVGHDGTCNTLNRNTVARLPWAGTLAFKPQIERLCRYVEEQSRRGPTAVGHEKTHPRSERSGDLPSAGDSDQLRKRGSSPFLSKKSSGGSGGLRSIHGFRAVHSVCEALSLHGKEGRAEQREAAAGNGEPKAREVGTQEVIQEEGFGHCAQEKGERSLKDCPEKEICIKLTGPGRGTSEGRLSVCSSSMSALV